MCGCMQIPKNNDSTPPTTVVEMSESSRQDEIHDYFDDYDIDVISRDYDGNDYIVCEGTLNGFISRERRGNNGFGFDEIFELPNGKTLAELSIDEKNKISARALALAKLKEKIN